MIQKSIVPISDLWLGQFELSDLSHKKGWHCINKESDKEKYIGDYFKSKDNSKETIATRKIQRYGILGEIIALKKYVPLGNRRTQIGLELRKAWFHNKCLCKSEVWFGILKICQLSIEKYWDLV